MNLIALIATITSVVVFYFIGHILSFILRIKPYSDFAANAFVKTVLGLLFCVFVCAVICTRGNTILWGIPIVGLLCWFNNRKNCVSLMIPEKKELFAVVIIIAFSLVSFFYQAWHFYNQPFYNLPYIDYGFYGMVGEKMVQHHCESTVFVTNIYADSRAASPYHYFDIWFSVMYSVFLKINYVESLYILAYSVLFSLYAFSIIVITRTYCVPKYVQILSLATLCFYPLAWFDFSIPIRDVIFTPHFLGTHSLVCPKNIVIALFMAFSLVIYRTKCRNFYLSLLLLPVVSTITAPAVFIAVSIILFSLFFLKKEKRKEILYSTICVFAIALFILLFYVFQPHGLNTGGYSFDNLSIVYLFKSVCKLIFCLCLFHMLFIGAITIPLIQKKDKSIIFHNIEWFSFAFVLLISGFLFAQMNQGKTDANQFYTSVILILPLVYETCFVCLFALCNKTWQKGIVGVLVIGFCLYSILVSNKNTLNDLIRKAIVFPYEITYMNNVQRSIQDFETPAVASLKNSYYYFPYYYYNDNRFKIETSCISEKCLDNERYSFAEYARQNEQLSNSLEQLQLQFCKFYDIRFLIIDKGEELPDIFVPEVDTIYTDRNTGERFVVLKHE